MPIQPTIVRVHAVHIQHCIVRSKYTHVCLRLHSYCIHWRYGITQGVHYLNFQLGGKLECTVAVESLRKLVNIRTQNYTFALKYPQMYVGACTFTICTDSAALRKAYIT